LVPSWYLGQGVTLYCDLEYCVKDHHAREAGKRVEFKLDSFWKQNLGYCLCMDTWVLALRTVPFFKKGRMLQFTGLS
jgi:hypothetical protein